MNYFDPLEYPQESPVRYILGTGYLFGTQWFFKNLIQANFLIVEGDALSSGNDL
jgi:hypothetical protein